MCSPEMSQCRLSRLPQRWRLCSRIVLKILSAIRKRIFVVQEFLHFFLKIWNCQLFFIINFKITTQNLFLGRIFRTPTFATLFLGTTWIILKSTGQIKSGAEIHATYMMLYSVNCMKISAIKLNCPFYFQWAVNCMTFTAFIDGPGNCDCPCVALVRPTYGKKCPKVKTIMITLENSGRQALTSSHFEFTGIMFFFSWICFLLTFRVYVTASSDNTAVTT